MHRFCSVLKKNMDEMSHQRGEIAQRGMGRTTVGSNYMKNEKICKMPREIVINKEVKHVQVPSKIPRLTTAEGKENIYVNPITSKRTTATQRIPAFKGLGQQRKITNNATKSKIADTKKEAINLYKYNTSRPLITRKANQSELVHKKIPPKISNTKIQTTNINVKPLPLRTQSTTYESVKDSFKPIEDIDVEDGGNVTLMPEYVKDIYEYLFESEAELPVHKYHLHGQLEVTPKMRAILIDWLIDAYTQFHLNVETFQIAIGVLDRYLQLVKDTTRPKIQLVGITALFIASKFEELYSPPVRDFIYITDNTYTVNEVRTTEMQILQAIDFRLVRPYPIQFLRRFSKAGNVQPIQHDLAKYFIELSFISYDLASSKPSELAAASLFLAVHVLNTNCCLGYKDELWNNNLQFYSHYTARQLRPIAKKIAILALMAPNATLKAAYEKFKDAKFSEISQRPELYGELMKSLTA